MREYCVYIIDFHTLLCNDKKPMGGIGFEGVYNKCRYMQFVFQLNYQFYVVEYPQCRDFPNHIEARNEILKSCADSKDCHPYEITRNESIDKKFFNSLTYEGLIKKCKTEIVHIYNSGNSRERKCFIRPTSFLDYLSKMSEFKKDMEETINLINETDRWSGLVRAQLVKDVIELYNINTEYSIMSFPNSRLIKINEFLTNLITKQNGRNQITNARRRTRTHC